MKAKSSLSLLIITIISFLSCSVSASVTLEYLGIDKYVSFKIANDHLKEPLIITPNETGAIFYETADSRTFLSGEPFYTKNVKGGFYGKWRNTDGRIVEVLIKPRGNNFDIDFTAEPCVNIRKWGLSLGASPEEFFTGCLERTVSGHQRLS